MKNQDVREFIARMQADPATATVYLSPGGDNLDLQLASTDWTATARVLRDDNDAVIAAAAVEIDVDSPRAWVLGPLVAPELPAETRRQIGQALVIAMAQQAPHCRLELLADHTNTLFAEIADAFGWAAPFVERLYVDPDGTEIPVADDETEAWQKYQDLGFELVGRYCDYRGVIG